MSIQIAIPMHTLTYTEEQFIDWKEGRRDSCPDPACKGLPDTRGFGENIVGNYFESLGYKWIHHNYNVAGGNKPGKYPDAETVLIKCLGSEKFEFCRTLYKSIKNIEEPDLLIFRPDYSEIRFAESKREDTYDKLHETKSDVLLFTHFCLVAKWMCLK